MLIKNLCALNIKNEITTRFMSKNDFHLPIVRDATAVRAGYCPCNCKTLQYKALTSKFGEV